MSDTSTGHVWEAEKVVGMRGYHVPGAPASSVMAVLDELRAKAERGEITGFAYAASNAVGDSNTGWVGEGTVNGQAVIGFSIQLLQHTYTTRALEGSRRDV